MKSERKGDESKQGKGERIFQHFYPFTFALFSESEQQVSVRGKFLPTT